VQQGDGQWAALEPLVEAARPKGKTRPRDLRRTLEAIVWRHRNGATWRAIPAELGPWWRAAQLFIRWAELGAWQRLLETAQGRGVELGVAFLDGTSAQRDRREALGRSRGGFGTKACVVADGRGRAAAFALAPRQAHELPLAPGLLDQLPRVPLWVVGDRGYSSDAFRDSARLRPCPVDGGLRRLHAPEAPLLAARIGEGRPVGTQADPQPKAPARVPSEPA
jgi:transposase